MESQTGLKCNCTLNSYNRKNKRKKKLKNQLRNPKKLKMLKLKNLLKQNRNNQLKRKEEDLRKELLQVERQVIKNE